MKKKAFSLMMAAMTAAATLGSVPVFADTVTIDVGTFTNVYTPTAVTLEVPVTKTMTITGSDKKLADFAGKFTFKMTEYTDDKYETVKEGTTALTATNDAEGKLKFSTEYKTTGTHYYKITEVAGNQTGVTYTTTEYKVKVVVSGENGTLKTAITDSEGKALTATFNNTYKPTAVDIKFSGKKAVTDSTNSGVALKGGEFSFQLYNAKGEKAGTATNDKDGNVVFKNISLESVGTYTYTVAEIKGTDSKWSYDKSYHTVQFTVTDDNGTLKATQNKADGDNLVKVSETEPTWSK